MANLLSTNVTGTINSTGNTTAAGFTGNANVAGTGAATYHPSGIYSTGTNWLYGTMYLNNNHINDVGFLGVGQAVNTNYRIITNGDYYANSGGNYWAEGRFKQYRGSGTWHDVIDSGNIGNQSVNYAASAGAVAASGITGQTGMWTSAARPGAYRLYRNDDNSAYNVQTTWSADVSGYWSLRGYNGDTYHAPCYVGYAGYASSAGSAPANGGNSSTVGGFGAGSFFRDLGFEGGGANANTIAETRSAFTYASGSPWTGPLAYFGASGYGLQLNATYQSGINISYRTRNGDNATWNSWREFIHSGNIGSQSVSNADTVDSYHASNFLGKNGNSYYQADNWIQLNGGHGLYAPSYYSAHFYPNVDSTYTQWAMNGNKSSYGGIYDYYSRVNGFMYDSGGNGGVYREANSRWYWYHSVDNNCMGIANSTTSSSYRLYVSGAIYATEDIVAYSDRRKKANIITIDNALDKVLNLRGVYYTKLDDETGSRKTGVIAQEINEILPEVVTYAQDVDEYGVSYGNIVGVLIEAIKEQQAQIDDLKKRLGE